MIAENPRTSSTSKPYSEKPLRRGRACLNCRFLKIKCDATKPICGPCLRHPKDDPCEYSDGTGRSRTKVLEDTVSRLEARLHELEHPDETTPSVTLQDPYTQPQQREVPKLLLLSPPESQAYSPLPPFSPTSTTSSLPSGSSGSSTSPARSNSSFLGQDEPPFLVIQSLLDKFIPHSSQFGFFLHTPRFYNSALLPFSFGDYSRPTPGLLSTVYLWGAHLSRSQPLLEYEYVFLTRALHNTSTDLFGAHPHRIIHTLQAEILLAFYFFRTGRFLEAKHHSGAAVSLALGCGFHRIRSVHASAPPMIGLRSDASVTLPAPIDDLGEGERVNGFWSIFMLQKVMPVALELPLHVCGPLDAVAMHIDTPWPMEIEDYKEGLFHVGVQGNSTVRNFITHQTSAHDGTSLTALNVKASILLHRATHLTGQWAPSMQPKDSQMFAANFQSADRLIDAFRITLPSLGHYDSSYRTLLLIHALTDAATIKLHSIFAYADPLSKQKCLTAARNIVQSGDAKLHELTCIHPIMGTLWASACQVFIDELSRVRSLRGAWPPSTSDANEEELMEGLRSGITFLSLFSEDNPLIKYQLTTTQKRPILPSEPL